MLVTYDDKKNEILVSVPSEVISKEALLKCLYWYLTDYQVELSDLQNNGFVVTLKPKNDNLLSSSEFLTIKNKVNQDIIDFSLRQIVANETSNIRDLLIAKAFKAFE